MPRTVYVEFGPDAPPAQGGASFDLVDEGDYRLIVEKADETQSQAESKPMIKVTFRIDAADPKLGLGRLDSADPEKQFAGRRLGINFVLPREGTQDAKFGKQRFHAFLIALGYKDMSAKTTKVPIDLDKLIGRPCESEVRYGALPAKGNSPERKTSEPQAFYRIGTLAGKKNGTGPAAIAAAAPVAPQASAPPPPVDDDPGPTDPGAGDAEDDLFDT